MADEDKAVNTEAEAEQSTPQYSDTEQRAMELGWKPEDAWVEDGNDAKDHRSAKDFLERGEMIGKLRAQDRELQQQRLALTKIAEKSNKIYENGYQNAIKDLKAQRREALRDDDFDKVDLIEDEIARTEQRLEGLRREEVVPKTPAVDPDYEPWVQANPWYQDKVMQKFADALAVEYIQENSGQVSPKQVRDFVATIVRKEFAHKFEGKKVTGAPNPDGNGRASSGKDSTDKTSLSKIKAGLSDEERSIMKTMAKATGMTEEQYLKKYASL